jgi:hypothetical protein
VEANRPPCGVLLNEPDHEWCQWCNLLLKADALLKNWMVEGIPVWIAESDRVTFDVKAKVSRPHAALERVKEQDGKKKKQVHGRYYQVEPRLMEGADWPTLDEWMKEQAEKNRTKDNQVRKPPHISR